MDHVSGAAARLLQAWDSASLAALPSADSESFDLAAAWRVADELLRLRQARGEQVAGWKIGFTNRSIWQRYGVHAPIWGPVWKGGLALLDAPHATISLDGLCQPRLEPEIVFGLRAAPLPDMDLQALQGCIEWVAHGFELVHTHYADWRFTAPDTVADFALHGRLLVGRRVPVTTFGDLADELSALRLELYEAGHLRDAGQGAVVLDGPLHALRHWLQAMAKHTPHWRVEPGHVVTTGTITDAWPLKPGQHWQTQVSDPRLSGMTLTTEGQ